MIHREFFSVVMVSIYIFTDVRKVLLRDACFHLLLGFVCAYTVQVGVFLVVEGTSVSGAGLKLSGESATSVFSITSNKACGMAFDKGYGGVFIIFCVSCTSNESAGSWLPAGDGAGHGSKGSGVFKRSKFRQTHKSSDIPVGSLNGYICDTVCEGGLGGFVISIRSGGISDKAAQPPQTGDSSLCSAVFKCGSAANAGHTAGITCSCNCNISCTISHDAPVVVTDQSTDFVRTVGCFDCNGSGNGDILKNASTLITVVHHSTGYKYARRYKTSRISQYGFVNIERRVGNGKILYAYFVALDI